MEQKVPKLWIFFFFLVVFLVIGLVFTTPNRSFLEEAKDGDSEVVLDESVRSKTFESMLETGQDAVYIENQNSSQREITVGYVVLSHPGYVVIYNDNGGIPGNVIGDSGLLQEGGEHIAIRLDEALVEQGVYYAVLYHDDGDNEFYEVHDPQVIDSQGSVILMTFEALETANPEIGIVQP